MEDCIFCKIIKGEIPATYLYESEKLVAINDINPSADKHILIIPKKHTTSFLEMDDMEFLSEACEVAKDLISEMKIEDAYKLIFNGGKYQFVQHLHWHLLGGNMKKEAI